ncbi:ribonuclease HII [Allosphingosinicella vermicomposti]|uniref:ribonuclease HII n=1 Tax=Allosphingosinicella vermicomposti TaxID=614671 RepID=UPI000D0EC771|nr:ribonuclease HII [Allosphingosinicella vermicomposti]
MTAPCFKIEKDYAAPIVGVDEAGRGPLAGPVVAAAVILDRKHCPRGIDDSKKLCLEVRESLYGKLQQVARIGVGIATVEEIDRYNILWATMLAMTRAVEALGIEPGMVLVDGNRCPKWTYPSTAIIGGDAKSRSIAAASIIAKVTRDRMMAQYCDEHPGYNWRSNKGYGTPDHRAALDRLGPTPLHRRSFAPVKQHLLDL